MHCRPLDPGDRYHQRLANIVEEMRIATGGPRIECVTVRTLGLNAFAFSDLHGGGVIGVTEGALARLSRQQLQGVVAHEFAHILSGTYVTVTVSCLLFGIYSALGDKLDDARRRGRRHGRGAGALGMVPLRGWLWLLQLASSVVNSALSRERERQADLAAARYTRDPLSLAEALRIIGRHPGGAGYIPEGLAPLCIRATGTLGWPAVSWRDTHPPLGERIGRAARRWRTSRRTSSSGRPSGPARTSSGASTGRRRRRPAEPARSGRGCGQRGRRLGARGAPLPAPRLAPARRRRHGLPELRRRARPRPYEGIDIALCALAAAAVSCRRPRSGKILARREVAFTDDQQRLADLLAAGGDRLRRAAVLARGRPGVALIPCPRCATPMMRRHYSYEHAVEIDYCSICDLFWFEKDELEALQILVERQAG